MTTRKHTGLRAQHVWRHQPLQTPNSGKGYGQVGEQSGLAAPLLQAKASS